ncbi:transmembrane protein 176 [Trichomycterus rosablanca]|uniref:transmembrane protein 176 n=1 Tax=Trichomycterus rosablanca TaxID=2290929 RepID=UPI002F3559D5
MALTVSCDLSVNVDTDQNVNKLAQKQEALRKSIQKGDPKSIGISQVMLGFMIISYSVPLISAELTDVFMFGVPWWSAITFIISGAIALITEKRNSIVLVFVCLVVTVAAAFISVIAVIIFMVDMVKHPTTSCLATSGQTCDYKHYVTKFSFEMKFILLILYMVQTAISSAFACILYKERQQFTNYLLVDQ